MYKVSSRVINLYCFIFSGCLQLLLKAGEIQGRGKLPEVSQRVSGDERVGPMNSQCGDGTFYGWKDLAVTMNS